MTETTQDIIKSKLDAVEALVEALDAAIDQGNVTSVGDVQRLMRSWLNGMRSLVPAESTD